MVRMTVACRPACPNTGFLKAMVWCAALDRSDTNRQTELVIFLRATIIEDSGASPADIDLYKTFGRDRRPLPF